MRLINYVVIVIILTFIFSSAFFYLLLEKRDVEKLISKHTNSKITFDNFGLSVYPMLSLKLSNVKYDDKENAKVNAKQLYIGFDISSFLERENIKIDSLLLNEAKITIYPSEKNTNKKSSLMDIQNLRLKNSNIHYVNYRFNALDLDASINNSIIKLNNLYMKNWNDIKDITVFGAVNLSKKVALYNLVLQTERSNPKALLKEFKVKLPELKTISLDAKITGTINNLHVKNTSVIINGDELILNASMKNLDLNTIKSDVKINKLDLNKYIKEGKTSSKKVNYESYFENLRKITHTGILKIKHLKYQNYDIKDLLINLNMSKGMIHLDSSSFKIYDGIVSGSYALDIRKKVPKMSINQHIKNISLAKLINNKQNILKGNINLRTKFKFQSFNKKQILNSLKGEKKMWGKDIILEQYNVDEILSKFEETKKVNLLDIGAIFLAGPFAGLFTQGTKFALLQSEVDKKGTTKIKEFLSVWSVNNKTAKAKDVAVKTSKNIIALKGSINLESKKFDDIIIAVLDKNRCAKFSQTLEGDLSKNKIGIKESAAEAFLSPISGIFESAGKLIAGCDAFYTGKLK